MKKYSRQYEKSVTVSANPETVFTYADDHRNFSSHMNQSSWMMGGGSMQTETDEGQGKEVGSHIRMSGTVFGIQVSLDEVIIKHEPPKRKTWETVGDVNLLVIDAYALGFEITPREGISDLKVRIDYDLPKSWKTRWLGRAFGELYARWCVEQMVNGTQKHLGASRQK